MTTDLMTRAMKVVFEKKTLLPVLESVLIANNSFTVTDLNTFLTIKDVGLEGPPFFLCLRDLADTVLKFEDEFDVELIPGIPGDKEKKIEPVPGKAIFRMGNRTYKFFSDGGEDFPNLPIYPAKNVGDLFLNDIEKIVLAASFTSKDDLRSNMQFVGLEDGEIAATDGHRLYFDTTDFKGRVNIYLNRKTCKLLSLFQDETFSVSLTKDTRWVYLESESIMIRQKSLSEKFPEWKTVIPKSNPISVSVNRKELESTIREALKFANKITHAIAFNLNGSMKLHAEDMDYGTEFDCEIQDFEKMGGDVEIAFNGEFLLTCFPKDATRIKLDLPLNPLRAGIVNDHFLIMPIKYLERV